MSNDEQRRMTKPICQMDEDECSKAVRAHGWRVYARMYDSPDQREETPFGSIQRSMWRGVAERLCDSAGDGLMVPKHRYSLELALQDAVLLAAEKAGALCKDADGRDCVALPAVPEAPADTDAERELREARAGLAQVNSVNAEMAWELAGATARSAALEPLREALNLVEKERDDLQKQLADTRSELAAELREARQALDRANAKLAVAAGRFASLKALSGRNQDDLSRLCIGAQRQPWVELRNAIWLDAKLDLSPEREAADALAEGLATAVRQRDELDSKLQAATTRIAQLEKQLADAAAGRECVLLSEWTEWLVASDAERELRETRAALVDCQATRDRLTRALADQKEHSDKKRDALYIKARSLAEQRDALAGELRETRALLADAQDARSRLTVALTDEKEQHASLRQTNLDAQDRIAGLQDQLAEAKRTERCSADSGEQLATATAMIAGLEKQLSIARIDLANSQATCDRLSREILPGEGHETLAMLRSLSGTISSTERERDEAMAKLRDANTRIAELEKQLDAMTADRAALATALRWMLAYTRVTAPGSDPFARFLTGVDESLLNLAANSGADPEHLRRALGIDGVPTREQPVAAPEADARAADLAKELADARAHAEDLSKQLGQARRDLTYSAVRRIELETKLDAARYSLDKAVAEKKAAEEDYDRVGELASANRILSTIAHLAENAIAMSNANTQPAERGTCSCGACKWVSGKSPDTDRWEHHSTPVMIGTHCPACGWLLWHAGFAEHPSAPMRSRFTRLVGAMCSILQAARGQDDEPDACDGAPPATDAETTNSDQADATLAAIADIANEALPSEFSLQVLLHAGQCKCGRSWWSSDAKSWCREWSPLPSGSYCIWCGTRLLAYGKADPPGAEVYVAAWRMIEALRDILRVAKQESETDAN